MFTVSGYDGWVHNLQCSDEICICKPTVWGDLLTVLSNIWLMFIALSLTARDNEHIALNLIYEKLPSWLALYIRQFWKLMIILIGLVLINYGFEIG